MKGLAKRLFDPRADHQRAPSPPPPAADGITFAFSLGRLLFTTSDLAERIYFSDGELYFDIPKGTVVELLAREILGRSREDPAQNEAEGAITSLRIEATARGAKARAVLHSYGPDGALSSASRRISTGRTRVPASSNAAIASRAGLLISGEGQLAIHSFKCIRGSADEAALAPVEPGRADPLVDLVRSDYLAARRAGAEIPAPDLVSI